MQNPHPFPVSGLITLGVLILLFVGVVLWIIVGGWLDWINERTTKQQRGFEVKPSGESPEGLKERDNDHG